jgi:hypothetical protein
MNIHLIKHSCHGTGYWESQIVRLLEEYKQNKLPKTTGTTQKAPKLKP